MQKTLEDILLKEHSKAHAVVIAHIVEQKPELLNELIRFTFADEEPLSRRASWPLRIFFDQNPNVLKDQLDVILDQLKHIKNKAILRNILALLTKANIPENKKTFVLDFTTKIILNPESPIAVIAHATDLFLNISRSEMALIQELLLMLEQINSNNSGGIKSKIKQVDTEIKRLKKNPS